MTASEQIAIWAEASDDLLVGFTYDDKPCVFQQIEATEAVVGFSRHSASIDIARVTGLNGVTSIIVEGRFPKAGGAYRAVLSSAESFK